MKPEFVTLAQYRLEKARKTLEDAVLFSGRATSGTIVNRIYYALFYAVTALLITDEKYSAKHSGVRSLFNRDFVKTGIIPVADGKFFSEMYDSRQEGDYGDYKEFTSEEITSWLDNARSFIDRVGAIVVERCGGKAEK
ncbi:MAG: HEPN domain-containing protein [Spirochaetes bacterium]|nr:HEPN domain-containing protein [Spirochaetota bacterium]